MSAMNQLPARCRPPAASAVAQPAGRTSVQVKSTDLLKGHKAVDIEHNGAVYRLQTTKLGKLILTK